MIVGIRSNCQNFIIVRTRSNCQNLIIVRTRFNCQNSILVRTCQLCFSLVTQRLWSKGVLAARVQDSTEVNCMLGRLPYCRIMSVCHIVFSFWSWQPGSMQDSLLQSRSPSPRPVRQTRIRIRKRFKIQAEKQTWLTYKNGIKKRRIEMRIRLKSKPVRRTRIRIRKSHLVDVQE